MKITCWGARGSIPVSGKEYVKYGGDTTCIEIRSGDDDVIIVDAGTGMRRLGNKLLASDRRTYNVLFTHAHWDHLMGLPFFKPLYEEGTKIRMFGCAYAQRSVREVLSQCMVAPYFPVDFNEVRAEISSQEAGDKMFEIGSLRVTPMQLSHPNRGSGTNSPRTAGVSYFSLITNSGSAIQGEKSTVTISAFRKAPICWSMTRNSRKNNTA